MEDLAKFFEKYDIKPHNRKIYERAFTHSSFNSDAKTSHYDYERLEFLGDSVLSFVIASNLYIDHKDMLEGDLTKAKASLVQSKTLAKLARKEGFTQFIKIGHSLNKENAFNNDSILEDIFEAVIGAIYLDQGFEFVKKFIEKIYHDDIKNLSLEDVKDYKSILQEAMQAEHRESVSYKVVDEKGPPHNKTFYVEVYFNDLLLGKGVGASKKRAEQMAAKDALNKKAI